MDTATEKAIHNTFEELSQGITTLIIAHRLSTIKHCDKIVVLDEGKIVEIGSHEKLIKQQGEYYKLCKGQTVDDNMELGEKIS